MRPSRHRRLVQGATVTVKSLAKRKVKRSNQLHGHRRRFTAADAKRCDATLQAKLSQGSQESNDDSRATGANGVTKRAGAAVDIDDFMREFEFRHRGHGHSGERFIDLPQIDVIDFPLSAP